MLQSRHHLGGRFSLCDWGTIWSPTDPRSPKTRRLCNWVHPDRPDSRGILRIAPLESHDCPPRPAPAPRPPFGAMSDREIQRAGRTRHRDRGLPARPGDARAEPARRARTPRPHPGAARRAPHAEPARRARARPPRAGARSGPAAADPAANPGRPRPVIASSCGVRLARASGPGAPAPPRAPSSIAAT